MRVKTVVAAGVLSAAALLVAPAPAQAAAPSCLTFKLNDRGVTDHLYVWNTCKTAQRYKVRLANRTDMPCSFKRPNSGATHWWWRFPGRFDGLVSC
jgi:hypothetical protein